MAERVNLLICRDNELRQKPIGDVSCLDVLSKLNIFHLFFSEYANLKYCLYTARIIVNSFHDYIVKNRTIEVTKVKTAVREVDITEGGVGKFYSRKVTISKIALCELRVVKSEIRYVCVFKGEVLNNTTRQVGAISELFISFFHLLSETASYDAVDKIEMDHIGKVAAKRQNPFQCEISIWFSKFFRFLESFTQKSTKEAKDFEGSTFWVNTCKFRKGQYTCVSDGCFLAPQHIRAFLIAIQVLPCFSQPEMRMRNDGAPDRQKNAYWGSRDEYEAAPISERETPKKYLLSYRLHLLRPFKNCHLFVLWLRSKRVFSVQVSGVRPKNLYLTILPKQRMIPGEASEPLLLADTAPDSQRYFCARNPENGRIACALAYGREGGEYNTRKGNKPACLAQVLNLPLTSGSSEALCEWCLNAMLEAFMMTCHSSRQRRACALSHSLDQIDLALEAERTLIDAMLFVANETLCKGREGQMLHGLLYLLSEHQAKTEQAASDAHRALREQREVA